MAAHDGDGVRAKPNVEILGISHTAALARGGVRPHRPDPNSELERARTRKLMDKRRLISSTDAFRGKDD